MLFSCYGIMNADAQMGLHRKETVMQSNSNEEADLVRYITYI